ncbi:contractile injection system protein, VgrG/Pvc8 family [Pseudomonas sp. PCH446]
MQEAQRMFTSAPRFTFSLVGLEQGLEVLAFKGTEAISQPYRFELELVSRQPDLNLDELLHRQGFLAFNNGGTGIHGQIYGIGQGDTGQRWTHYQLTLVPQLAYLGHRFNQRIFQNQSVRRSSPRCSRTTASSAMPSASTSPRPSPP